MGGWVDGIVMVSHLHVELNATKGPQPYSTWQPCGCHPSEYIVKKIAQGQSHH